LNSQLAIANCVSATSALAAPMLPRTGPASGPASSAPNRAGPLEMQTRQKCPPRRITPLECTLTNNGLVGSSECPVTNSLDLNSPGIRASWTFGSPEVLWRSSTPVTPLECTDTKNGLISPLECTDTNSLDLKSFRFHSYKKHRGAPLSSPFSITSFSYSLSPVPFAFTFYLLHFLICLPASLLHPRRRSFTRCRKRIGVPGKSNLSRSWFSRKRS